MYSHNKCTAFLYVPSIPSFTLTMTSAALDGTPTSLLNYLPVYVTAHPSNVRLIGFT